EEKEKRYLTHAIWHEIKTPLTVLKGYAQILLEEIQEPELTEKCQKIDFQIDRLEKVISQLRYLTRPDVNENFINVQNFIDMIHQILHSWKAEIDDLKLKVQVNAKDTNKYEDSVLEFSQGDLFMVISNLISNAIRFNRSEGLVDVSLLVRQKTLIFEIKDNGPGIPEGIKDLIFKPLGYASFSGEKSQGMGLYLVKEAVRRGGGRLTIRSRADSGTTIRIFIPFH
ncbi:MAG: HAMP domain-containing histidine kinase, partial [Candidatus Atribacteria bacterium]|nr:HAMP domain-containing histidine kinase [Candidatus Atribacteria bacterium]